MLTRLCSEIDIILLRSASIWTPNSCNKWVSMKMTCYPLHICSTLKHKLCSSRSSDVTRWRNCTFRHDFNLAIMIYTSVINLISFFKCLILYRDQPVNSIQNILIKTSLGYKMSNHIAVHHLPRAPRSATNPGCLVSDSGRNKRKLFRPLNHDIGFPFVSLNISLH